MINFYLTLVTLVLVAMAFVAVPLWRGRHVDNAEDALAQRRDKNREVFLQREKELDRELEQGIVNADDHARMRTELERAFLLDMEALNSSRVTLTARRSVVLPLVGLVLIPIVSILIYRQWGAADELVLPQLISQVQQASGDEEATLALNQLADQLQLRFNRHSGDLQSGYMLGTLYLELDRFDAAAKVFERMLEDMTPSPDRATVLGQLAQAEYMRNDSQIDAHVQSIIDEALALNPDEYAVLSILAIDAFLKQDMVAAIGYWRRQLAASEPNSQQAATLRQRIAAVEAYLPQDQRQPAETAAVAASSVTLTIDIDPQYKAQLDEYQSLFVYVRNPAMPMPIAAQNLAVPEFPLTLTLDDSMTMMGMTLGSAPELLAGARLSRTGVANRQSGDLQVESMPFTLSEQQEAVTLVIDQVVP